MVICFGGMMMRGKGSSIRMMARESSLGGSLLRSTLKGMISFPAIGSREEESSAMEERGGLDGIRKEASSGLFI
jgi:hypothetical protein